MSEEIKTFYQYWEENPRPIIPNELMRKFIKFAIRRYAKCGDFFSNQKDHFVVNMSHSDNLEDMEEEVEDYIGECMEALLLFKEFLESEKN